MLEPDARSPFLSPFPVECAVIKNEHKQTGGVVPRLLITAGLAPTTKGRHTQSQHSLAQVIILEYIRSGINLCFLYAILKRGTLVHSHRHTQTLLDLMKRERKKGKKQGKTKPRHLFSFFYFPLLSHFLPCSPPPFFSPPFICLIDGLHL